MAGLVATSISELSASQLAQVEAIYQEAFAPDLRVPFWQFCCSVSRRLNFVPSGDYAARR